MLNYSNCDWEGDSRIPPLTPDNTNHSASILYPENRRKRPRLFTDQDDQSDPPQAACGQCRLRKVRCDRLQPKCSQCRKGDLECHTSNIAKRINHVKSLRNDFSNVMSRLNDVAHALDTLTEITLQGTSKPYSNTVNTFPPPNYHSHENPGTLPPVASGFVHHLRFSSQDRGPVRAFYKPLIETVKLDHGGERLYSYPAPIVLIMTVFRQAEEALAYSEQPNDDQWSENPHQGRKIHDPVVKATLQRKLQEFPFGSSYREFGISSDMKPLTTPPRLMANLFVDGYLRNINTRTPIFDDGNLHQIITSYYSDETLQCSEAYSLIINNFILLELGLEIKASRGFRSASHLLHDDILPSFLKNCNRAITRLDDFKTPTIISLQALMTLTLVAEEFYSNITAERVCQAACQLGRIMGIHLSNDDHQDTRIGTTDVRGRLFRILYAMDKVRVSMTGQPCDLYLFDSDHYFGPESKHSGEEFSISDAFDHLMTIWEDIYLNLYTPRTARFDSDKRLAQMRLLTSSIDRFAQTHARLLVPSIPDDTIDQGPLRIELLYGYQVSQILILRCGQQDEPNLSTMLNLCRSSLKLINRVCAVPLTITRLALLSRMFRRYPVVAYAELVTFHLSSHSPGREYNTIALSDIALLREVNKKYKLLQFDNLTCTFYARRMDSFVWALEILETVTEALARPSSLSPERQQDNFFEQIDYNNNTIEHQLSYNDALDVPHVGSVASGENQYLEQQLVLPSHNENSLSTQNSSTEPGEMAIFGVLRQEIEQTQLIPETNSLTCHLSDVTAFGASQSQLELAPGQLSMDSDWINFYSSFMQEAYAPASRCD
ncbi:hypothetical protein F5B22DRAFT_422081 [Xylaria bambusicola]|uniref:uncharacterized protein n=1 Tax=Xylaria bambusicola TaxID=326684 RepID=UPI0020088B41|nr:uncharacterized protein F5B22DRAFT_422081 [Xylaria bambusicola]KAI0523888.1 hypothetical protein F5B22DRAFT_422081 [Xylaria bambusicola]